MRIVKLILLSVIVLFLLVTAISALLPSHLRVSRAIDISAPPAVIREQIASLDKWPNWNVCALHFMDKPVSADTMIGKGMNIFIQQRSDNSIRSRWEQPGGKSFTGAFNLFPNHSITTVQWYFDFTFRWYPWEKFSSIVYDAQVGPEMQQSLTNLKKIVENLH